MRPDSDRTARVDPQPDERDALRARVAELEAALEAERGARDGAVDPFRVIAEHTHDVVVEITLEGEFVSISPSIERVLGVRPEDYVGNNWLHMVHPGDRERVFETWLETLESREPVAVVFRALHADGHTVLLEASGKVVPDPAGGEQRVIIARDISDREETRMALEDMRARFDEFAEYVNDVFGVITPGADQFLYVSPAIERLLGRTVEELTQGAISMDWIHPDDRALVAQLMLDATPDRDLEFRCLRSDGETRWIWVRSWGIYDQAGELERIAFTVRDVTERRQAEGALRESREVYAALSELNSDFQFSVKASRSGIQIDWVTRAFERITGHPVDQIESWAWRDWIPADDVQKLTAWGRAVLLDGLDKPIDYRVITREGDVRWLQTRMRLFHKRDGVYHVLGSTTDRTGVKRLEEERRRYAVRLEVEVADRTQQLERANRTLRGLQERLMRAERMRTAEDLAASIAHSINNPLGALIGTVQMLHEREDAADPMLGRSLELCHRIRVVVDRTLQLFRRGALDLGLHDPRDVADEVCRELEERALAGGVKLELGLGPDLPSVEADRALLVAALVSVAENALDAMPDGGSLVIEVSAVPGVDVLRFCVRDTGIGIPESVRQRVLEPFFTTKGGGTGLGLAIAQGVVQGHDGRIDIQADPRGGTVVTIELPTRRGRTGSPRQS